MPGPLDHLIVVEASNVMPGAIAGMLLADHGAQVVKVEPENGNFFAHDLTRKSWDRGKRSIVLDVESADGLAQFKQLLARADVFIHSYTAAELAKLGLDRDGLAQEYPALVACVLTAYGADTPFHDRPYGESLAAARLGAMVDRGSQLRDGPVYLGHPALHYGQAFLAVIDILAALRARHENGIGQAVEASLLDSMVAQTPMNSWWQEDGVSYIKGGDRSASDRFGHTRMVLGLFECGDGQYLQVHTGSGGFKPMMDLLGFGDRIRKIDGLEMAEPLSDDEYQACRVDIFDAFKKKARDEWVGLFHANDVACLPVLEPADVLLDEQVACNNHRIELADAEFGSIYQAGPAIIFRDSVISKPTPAPVIGQDQAWLDAVLKECPIKGRARASGGVQHALQGLRVLDFSSFFACGYAGRLLSDLGADVIKVETPGGDQMRPLPNPFDAAQRGKRGLVVNLKHPEGQDIIRKLVATADVVMHNMRPGKADKIGLGYEALSAINPRLVYAYLPGYGSNGPKAMLKSFAPLISGWTGLLYEGGGEGNPPTSAVFGNEDYNNGFLGAAAVLMGLERLNMTGKGGYIECPQLHSSLFTSAEHFLDADQKPVYGLKLDAEQQGYDALDRIYRTVDGWIAISCRDDRRFAALCQAMGQGDMAADPAWIDERARKANDLKLRALLDAFFAELSSQQAFDRLDAVGAACEIVRETAWIDAFFHEQWAVDSGRVFDQPTSIYGHIREVGMMTHLSGTPGLKKGPAPRLGEHSAELLAELGYAAQHIETMAANKVIICG